MKLDREEDGLVGPVRTVRTRVEHLPYAGRRPPSSPNIFSDSVTYDEQGQKLERVTYEEDGSVSTRTAHIYDGAGIRVETLRCDSQGSVTGRSTYKQDASRNAAEEIAFDKEGRMTHRAVRKGDPERGRHEHAMYLADGRLMTRSVILTDDQGREKEILFCSDDREQTMLLTRLDEHGNIVAYEGGSGELAPSDECGEGGYLTGRLVCEYGESGNLIGHTTYGPDGTAAERFESIDDPDGRRSEVRHYDASGELDGREVKERESDERGNYVRQVISSWARGAGQPDRAEAREVHRREITYYDEAADGGGAA